MENRDDIGDRICKLAALHDHASPDHKSIAKRCRRLDVVCNFFIWFSLGRDDRRDSSFNNVLLKLGTPYVP